MSVLLCTTIHRVRTRKRSAWFVITVACLGRNIHGIQSRDKSNCLQIVQGRARAPEELMPHRNPTARHLVKYGRARIQTDLTISKICDNRVISPFTSGIDKKQNKKYVEKISDLKNNTIFCFTQLWHYVKVLLKPLVPVDTIFGAHITDLFQIIHNTCI